jgi:hypothetical protein
MLGAGWTLTQYFLHRTEERQTAAIEARKPFLEKRLQVYDDLISAASTIAWSDDADEVRKARRQFTILNSGLLFVFEDYSVLAPGPLFPHSTAHRHRATNLICPPQQFVDVVGGHRTLVSHAAERSREIGEFLGVDWRGCGKGRQRWRGCAGLSDRRHRRGACGTRESGSPLRCWRTQRSLIRRSTGAGTERDWLDGAGCFLGELRHYRGWRLRRLARDAIDVGRTPSGWSGPLVGRHRSASVRWWSEDGWRSRQLSGDARGIRGGSSGSLERGTR